MNSEASTPERTIAISARKTEHSGNVLILTIDGIVRGRANRLYNRDWRFVPMVPVEGGYEDLRNEAGCFSNKAEVMQAMREYAEAL